MQKFRFKKLALFPLWLALLGSLCGVKSVQAETVLSKAPAQATALTKDLKSTTRQGMTANTLDGIIVTVADEPLLLSELQAAVAGESLRVKGKLTQITPQGRLIGGDLAVEEAELILDQLINQKILTIRIRELGLNVADDELDSELKAYLQSKRISEAQLQEILKAEGQTEDSYREEFRKSIETQRFIGRIIRPLVSVTEDQVRGFYLQKNADKSKTMLAKLRSLMIEIPSGLSNEERQAKKRIIDTVGKEINAGRPFVELVRIYSDAKDAIKTEGLLPPRPMNELPEKLRALLNGKTPPLIVGPIEIGLTFFFFEYLGTEMGDQAQYQKERAKYEEELLDLKFKERLSEYLKNERLKFKVNRRNFNLSR
jgi:peptidyl-prolyl cis-trans isomerase SurA